ncbi:MAG TPA: HAD-IA family hydrolase [Candidatus Cloacimonadota bacterium]|nr:HAD-IA family hydrolase [Candidatus Cloacimonadota bacterium]HPT70961.1 HAD-IA family hydrolase [Candidatus Cloacimonadota bacterium]
MFKNLIWDFDGTLFDTYPAISRSLEGALKNHGINEDINEITALCKITLQTAIDHYCEKYGLDPDEIFKGYGEFYQTISLKDIPPFEGLRDVLEFCKATGRKNYIITHRPLYMLMDHLSYYDLDKYFEFMITSDDGYKRKPDPESFVALREKFDLPVELTLAIGDRDLDILAAKGAGFKTCLYQNPDRTIPADYFVSNMEELKALL